MTDKNRFKVGDRAYVATVAYTDALIAALDADGGADATQG